MSDSLLYRICINMHPLYQPNTVMFLQKIGDILTVEYEDGKSEYFYLSGSEKMKYYFNVARMITLNNPNYEPYITLARKTTEIQEKVSLLCAFLEPKDVIQIVISDSFCTAKSFQLL